MARDHVPCLVKRGLGARPLHEGHTRGPGKQDRTLHIITSLLLMGTAPGWSVNGQRGTALTDVSERGPHPGGVRLP